MAHPPPIERFLGPVDPATGPFGILGLAVRDTTPEEIDAALARRLARLESHRQGDSAEAGEVVLALHVAAAQLKDTTVRRAMLAQLPHPARSASTPPPDPPTHRGAPRGFTELARATIAHSGGWNRRSRRRIAGLAHTFGLSPDALRVALADLGATQRVATRTHARASIGTPRAPEDAQISPAPRWLIASTVAMFLCAALLLAILISIVVSRLPTGLVPVATPNAPAPGMAAPSLPDRVEPTDRLANPDAVRKSARDIEGALESLRRASAAMNDRPSEAHRIAADALAILASSWPEGDPVVVESAVAQLSSLLTTAVRTDSAVAARIADTIVGLAMDEDPTRPEGLVPRVFGAGAVARLSRDTLTGGIESRFRESVVRLSGDASGVRQRTFASGAALALVRSMRVCEGCPSAEAILPHWIRAHAGLEGIDPAAAEGALLDALDALVRGPASRQSDPVVSALAGLITFDRPESRAAIRVVGWLDDRSIASVKLAGMTSALVSTGAVPGAPLDILLSTGATEADRARVRDALAARLGVPITMPGVRTTDRLHNHAGAILGAPVPSDPVEALRLAARAAVIHHGAALQWAGRDAEAVLALADDDAIGLRLDSASQSLGARLDLARLTGPATGGDGQWALRFAQASRNEDERARLLLELRSASATLGPADADVLAMAALGPNPPLLRKTAQRTMLMHANNPFVIAAVTEAIPDAVATEDVADTISAFTLTELPRHDAPGFRAEAARAASARLLTVVAPSIDRRIMALQEIMGEAYAGIAAASADPLDRSVDASRVRVLDRSPAIAAESVVATLRTSARRYAEGRWTFVGMAELDRRHAARTGLPQTELERFIVHQLAIAETLAYLVAAERPTASADAARVVERMAMEHLSARHPMHQVLAAERGIAALWALRLGGAP